MIPIGEYSSPLSSALVSMQATSKEAEMQAGKEAMKKVEKAAESEPQKAKTCWSLYLLRREDGAIYTGISTNVERRFKEHTAGRGFARAAGETADSDRVLSRSRLPLACFAGRASGEEIDETR